MSRPASPPPRTPPPSPTRRSSDLTPACVSARKRRRGRERVERIFQSDADDASASSDVRAQSRRLVRPWQLPRDVSHDRSEEHTSELQSLRHLVCRLLLEKKKPLNT